MTQEHEPASRSLTLDLDQNLLQSALLEAILLLDQLRGQLRAPHLSRIECLRLADRSRLRLAYFFRHSQLARVEAVRRGLVGQIESFNPDLAQSLNRAHSQDHSQVDTLLRERPAVET